MRINQYILGALALLGMGSSWADPKLMGTWNSADANNGALNGSMTFEAKDSKVILEAENQPRLDGTWQVTKPGELTLTVADYGSTTMAYKFDKGRLTFTYDNGNPQTFEKKKAKK
jgi:hypothetical protein